MSSLTDRKLIRLPNYDYSQNGAYFITICAQNKSSLFGSIQNGNTTLNAAGLMIEHWWHELPHKYPHITLDEYIIMPNHFHGIILFNDSPALPAPGGHAANIGCFARPPQKQNTTKPITDIVGWFKTMTTNDYIRGVKENGWPTFDLRLWQRNYYEHVIRNEEELSRVREYIEQNPLQWDLDRENPDGSPSSTTPHEEWCV